MLFEKFDRILFAGDSVTDMGSENPVGSRNADALGNGYVRVVDSLLGAWYPELCLHVINSGISGNTSRDLLARFQRDVLDQKGDWISICIGINDVWRQFDRPCIPSQAVLPEEYEANVESMILAVKDQVKGVFLLSPYLMEANREDFMRKRIDEYVAICKRLAEKHGCIWVDLQQIFESYCQTHHSSRLAWDRIHPNLVGATLIAKSFLKAAGFDFNK